MELLHSSLRPVRKKAKRFFEQFEEYLKYSDSVLMTSGFISIESLLFLYENIDLLPQIEIVAGMHAFAGFTRSQYMGFKDLANELITKNKGVALICKAFPFHGKVYTFWKDDKPFAGIIGSSNISCIVPTPSRVFEVDLAFEDTGLLQKTVELQNDIKNYASVNFLDFPEPEFIEHSVLMDNLKDVVSLSDVEIQTIWKKSTDVRFRLPLKCSDKSNLNVYFGKGRENTATGLIKPRPWYEIEVIVPKSITFQKGYPYLRDKFTVVTDDGYEFYVCTNGTNSKNFRSQGGLVILGTWIKGRLEEAGILKVGEFIDESMLIEYGRNYIDLIATDNPDLWLISFDRKGSVDELS